METKDVLLIPFVARSDFDLEMSIPTDQKEVQKKKQGPICLPYKEILPNLMIYLWYEILEHCLENCRLHSVLADKQQQQIDNQILPHKPAHINYGIQDIEAHVGWPAG